MGSEPRNPTLPAQGMEEDSVSLGMWIKVTCVSLSPCFMALGLSVIIKKMGGLPWWHSG